MFVDKVKIIVKAGDGGDGIVSFLRYKGISNGGPDGGDGGNGGGIYFVADAAKTSLIDFYYKKKYYAGNGERGGSKNCFGKKGEDLYIKVPLGTVIKDYETDKIIFDMYSDGQTELFLPGGAGGKGNARFVTSRRHAPHFSQAGEKTQAKILSLELKTIADVGLIGFPNVGKSTLLSRISAAKPKIANYHFTTLSPNLGVVKYYDSDFVVADIPGLIEGASSGAGLGHDFLRHIERTRLLVHVIDITGSEGRNPVEDYRKINEELKNYNAELAKLPQIIAANKCDSLSSDENLKKFRKSVRKYKTIPISAVTGQGIDELLGKIFEELKKLPPPKPLEFEKYEYAEPDPDSFEVYKDEGAFVVCGPLVEVLARNVTFNDYHSFGYFQKILKDKGVIKRLRAEGAKDGDTVCIGDLEFDFKE